MESLFAPPSAEAVKRAESGETVAAPTEPVRRSLFDPPKQRSAQDIVQWAAHNKKNWQETAAELKEAGHKPSPEFGKQYEQQLALRAEKEKQGAGVGTLEQFARNAIPVGSAILNSRRESANAEAMKRYQEGKATPEDIETIATYQRRQDADREINSTLPGQLLNVVGQAPAIVGEAVGAGKVLGLAGKAVGLGKVAQAPLLAAANPSMGRAAINFAGKQALMTPLMPSMFLAHANQKNIEEGRDPNDVRGFVPALALGYVNNLVLGSLQKFGNVGSFPGQIANKAAIGVGEQAIGDVATGAADEFLNKSYKMGTRYGVLGNLARGEFGKGLEHATVQAFTFGYFAALHGKQPQRVTDAYRDLLDANATAGLHPEASAKVASDITATLTKHLAGRVAQASKDAKEVGRDFTAGDARNLFSNVDAVTKGMTKAQKAAVKKYIEELANVFPERNAREKRPVDPVVENPELRMGDEGPVAERPEPIESSLARPEPPRPEAPKPEVVAERDPLADYPPDLIAEVAKGLGLKPAGLKDPRMRGAVAKLLSGGERTAAAEPPRPEVVPPRPPAPPEAIAPPAQSGAIQGPTETAPRGERTHIANYKDPSRSVEKAIEMMEKRGSASLPVETWQDTTNARGQQAKGTAAFVFDTTNFSGEIHGRQGIDNLRNSKFPLPYDPALKKVVFKGDAEGPAYEKLRDAVYDMNRKRADRDLMRSVGHADRLPYVQIEVTGQGPALARLQKIDRRSGVQEGDQKRRASDKPAEVKPEPVPASEPTPPPKVTTAEKIAPDKVAFFPPTPPPKVTAERRSAPRPERKVDKETEVTGPEAKEEAAALRRAERVATYDQLPKSVRTSMDAVAKAAEASGLSSAPLKDKVLQIYRAAGLDGAKAMVELYQARHGKVSETAELDALTRNAEENAKKAEADYADATDAITRDQRVADNAELVRKLRERLRRDQEEADRIATEASDGKRPKAKAQASKPGQEKGKVTQPKVVKWEALKDNPAADRDYLKSLLDAAPESAREGLETAHHNMSRETFDMEPADRRRQTAERLASAWHEQLEAGNAPAAEAVAAAMVRFGAKPVGPKPGKVVEFDGHRHRSEDSVASGPVEVVRQPVVFKDPTGGEHVAVKGVVQKPVVSSQARTGKGATRKKTIADDVIEKGGIKWDSAMESHFGTQGEAKQSGLNRPGLFVKKGSAHSLDTMAESMKMTPQELIDALRGSKTSRLEDNTEYWENEQARREAERGEGDTVGEWKPSEEEIPFSRGDRFRGEKPSPEGKVGPFEIIAAQDKIFGVKNYVESGVPGAPGDVGAAARLKERATVTGKKAAGSEEVNLEEHAHHLQRDHKLPIDPSEFPLPVARGIQQFFGDRVEAYGGKPGGPPTRLGMIEGFADWLISRSRNDLKDLTPEQQIANEYLERWAASKGLTEKFDQVRDLYARMNTSASANVSATGKPVEADRTAGDRFEELTNKAEEVIDNDLAVLRRLRKDAEAKGYKVGVGEAPDMVYSQLMHADKARAGLFERDGVFTYVDGKRVQVGESLAKITEGAKPEWVTPGENGEASRAGTYAVARHVVAEAARGRAEVVSAEQLEGFRKFLESAKADVEFFNWAEGFAKRLTDGFNATREALAGKDVHFLSREEVDAWKEKFPDYIPTERVKQEGWKAGSGTRGESPRSITGERKGSGEQIVDPLISYKNRLRVTSAVMGEQLKRIAVEKLLKHPGMGNWGISTGETVKTELGKARTEKLKELGFTGDELKRTLAEMGLSRAEEYFTTKPWPTDGTKPTWGLKNADGKLVNYRIGDRALYDLITGQQVEANALASWLKATGDFLPVRLMTQAVKFGATSASLGFQFRNVPRDIYSFWSNTIDRMKANPKDLGDAYKRSFAFAWHQLTGHFGGKGSTDTLFKRFADERGDQLRQFAFDKDNPAGAYDAPKTGAIKTASTVWGILKDTLNLTGAGELAPRFLEWKTRLQQTTGKSEKELTEMLEAAEKATAEGRRVPDPIPLGVAIDAMNAAAEVTTNFNRLGSVTRQMNKITPFFGPAIAGLSKQVRNWHDNPKGAAFALSGLLGARLLHWIMFSDEEWYKELNSNDKFNNFVVPTPAGLRRLPAPRGLEVAGGGFLVTALDAAAGKNPDFKGLLKESVTGNLPPAPVPPVAKVGYEIATNENWMGSPIVPRRDEKASTVDKWVDHRGGYAADQLTGGLLSERRVPTEAKDAIPYSEVRNARRTVDDFFDKYEEMQEEKRKAELSGLVYKQNAEYARLNATRRQIIETGRAIRGERLVNGKVVKGDEPPEEKKKELRAKQLELAKKAMGR